PLRNPALDPRVTADQVRLILEREASLPVREGSSVQINLDSPLTDAAGNPRRFSEPWFFDPDRDGMPNPRNAVTGFVRCRTDSPTTAVTFEGTETLLVE